MLMVSKSTSKPIHEHAPRRFGNWVEAFVKSTAILPSPLLIRRWAAISAVAAALERRVWIRAAGSDLYPNLYIFLVTPPGVGKGLALGEIRKMFTAVPEIKLAPNSISKASLMDSLEEAVRKVVCHTAVPPTLDFNSLYILCTELGVLLPAWESEFMNSLTDIYDGYPYEERKRGTKLHIQIAAPQLNFIAATTPSYLNNVLPVGAWDQGFISRTILVYSAERQILNIFNDTDRTDTKDLQEDLKIIGKLQGKITWEESARELFTAWHMAGGPPVPQSPRLLHYNTRRTAHAIKLCMVASASRSNGLVIDEGDVGVAIGWLQEAERAMPDLFVVQSSGGESNLLEDTYQFLWREFARRGGNQAVGEHVLTKFVAQRTPLYNVRNVLDALVQGKYAMRVTGGDEAVYRPMPR